MSGSFMAECYAGVCGLFLASAMAFLAFAWSTYRVERSASR